MMIRQSIKYVLLAFFCLAVSKQNAVSGDRRTSSVEITHSVWEAYLSPKRQFGADTIPPYRPLEVFKGRNSDYFRANFSDRKTLFIGKPLHVLLQQLEPRISKYDLMRFTRDSTAVTGISLWSVDTVVRNGVDSTARLGFEITWLEPEPLAEGKPLRHSSGGKWTDKVVRHYGQRIVGDVSDPAIFVPIESSNYPRYQYKRPDNLGDTLALYRPLAEFGKDTLSYLRTNFENRKGLYVDKPLGFLLDQLEVPTVDYILSETYDNKINKGILLHFNRTSMSSHLASGTSALALVIIWANPIPTEDAKHLVKKGNWNWTKEQEEFFRKQLVGDVITIKGKSSTSDIDKTGASK